MSPPKKSYRKRNSGNSSNNNSNSNKKHDNAADGGAEEEKVIIDHHHHPSSSSSEQDHHNNHYNNHNHNNHKNNNNAVKGMDDCGTFYNSHQELQDVQLKRREEFYEANEQYWNNGGYGGSTDDEAMVGDTDGISDTEDGLAFLDRVLERLDHQQPLSTSHNHKSSKTEVAAAPQRAVAMDLGAGIGRITKHILLKRYDAVHLVEGNTAYSKQSRVYLGRKRAARCTFTNSLLQDLNEHNMEQEFGGSHSTDQIDLMWIQWTLQYLTDADVITCLRALSTRLRRHVGVLIVKENRPYGHARQDRFQMDTPTGENLRYDITRPDAHHRLLFGAAGLTVESVQEGVETNTYALMRKETS